LVFLPLAANKFLCSLQNFAPMTFTELQNKLFENYENGFVPDADLVQIIELASGDLKEIIQEQLIIISEQ
jgi:hypothetical protein